MKLRNAFLLAHRYAGLVTAIPVLLLSLSGAALVFEDGLDRLLNRSYWSVQSSGAVQSWQALADAAQQSRPIDPVTLLRIPPDPGIAAEFSFKSGLFETVDPHTGRVIGTRRRDQILTARIHQFHTRLLMGSAGERITSVTALLLILLGVSGIILWWNRRSFGIKWNAPWRRINYDSHYAFGFYGLLPWLALSATGAAIGFEGVVRPALYRMTASHQAATPTFRSTRAAHAAPIDIDSALAAVRNALPGADVTLLTLPQNATGVYTAYMKFPEDHTPAGRSHVAVDQYSANVLWLESSRTAPAGTKLWNLMRPVHTGDIFGWPTRILACLASAVLALQVISGVWMWLPARRAARTPSGTGKTEAIAKL